MHSGKPYGSVWAGVCPETPGNTTGFIVYLPLTLYFGAHVCTSSTKRNDFGKLYKFVVGRKPTFIKMQRELSEFELLQIVSVHDFRINKVFDL